VLNSTTYSFEIDINGTGAATVSFTSTGAASLAEIQGGLETALNAVLVTKGFSGADINVVTNAGATGITIQATNLDRDFVISNVALSTTTALTAGTYNSTSLLDNIGTSGYTLTAKVNGGANQVITFGTGLGQVSTLAELQTTLGTIAGISTSTASNSAVSFNLATSTSQNSLLLTSSNAALTTALGIGSLVGNTYQGTASVSTADPTRTSLQADYNNVLSQITSLAGDASFNGVNLLDGDNLKVVFNETGTSSLTITGVTFDKAGLGLADITGAGFQSDGDIDTAIATLDTALSTLRTQASKLGSNLTTVQTRQDFTKNVINTLQTGADNLVLADTNEEGANLLALQTRQQLSTSL
jgi:flagellin